MEPNLNQATNGPLFVLQGDFCTSCGAQFLRSFVTFEVLPVVEFQLEAGISDAEALALLGEDVLATTAAGAGGGRGVELGPGQGVGGGANVLRLDEDDGVGMDAAGFIGAGPGYTGALEDAFAAQVTHHCWRLLSMHFPGTSLYGYGIVCWTCIYL